MSGPINNALHHINKLYIASIGTYRLMAAKKSLNQVLVSPGDFKI